MRKGAATQVRLHFVASGVQALRHPPAAGTVHITVTFAPKLGKAVTRTGVVPVKPAVTKPAIISIQFSGGPQNPAVVVRGTNLGTKPIPNPAYHPAGQLGCPGVGGDAGYDYGTSLYIESVSKGFAGGRYRPDQNELDCLDLVVTRFTSSEADFRFGPFYIQHYPKLALSPGDTVRIVVNGASKQVIVKYG